jgi:hypothetical protein
LVLSFAHLQWLLARLAGKSVATGLMIPITELQTEK